MNKLRQWLGLNDVRNDIARLERNFHDLKLLAGTGLSAALSLRPTERIADAEFKVFSQHGDDGIIQFLIKELAIAPQKFVEVGTQDYSEANTRFLLEHDNWTGLIIDGSEQDMRRVRESDWFWKYDLTARTAFVTAENINALIEGAGFAGPVGLFSLDVDGNDFWVLKSLSVTDPSIIVVEYNWLFGDRRAITIPYDKDFVREKAHYSYLYFGASLSALHVLLSQRGYALVGCESCGANAYFVKRSLLEGKKIKSLSPKEAYVAGQFRQSRDKNGRLDLLSKEAQHKLIQGLPVYNVETNTVEPF